MHHHHRLTRLHRQAQAELDAEKFLAISTPGVMRPKYFRDVHAVLAASAGGPPDFAKVGEIMHRYGLTPAPPPTA